MKPTPILVDIHNHLIPGVDDGARTPEESLAALEAMREQGVRRAIATPHLSAEVTQREAFFGDRMAALDRGWEMLQEVARRVPEIELARGNEIMLDVPSAQLGDARVRLAGGRYVLVEFPRLQVPPGSSEALYRIKLEGYVPVVAHPERYANVDADRLDLVEEWRHVGARMVVNAGSVLGGFGGAPRQIAMAMLGRGWVDAIGSDYHARQGRRPLLLAEAYRRIVDLGGGSHAELLFSRNPGQIMDGAEPFEVPPLEIRAWRKLRSLFQR